MKSLFQTLEEYGNSQHYAFHMPGHKRQLAGDVLQNVSKIDITEIDGFDNLHDACGIIKDAQERGAAFFHSDESFFLVNGSTGGILSGISACVSHGDWILVARNCHRSVFHGIILNQLNVSYIYPDWDSELEFCKGIRGEQVEEAILQFQKEHPGKTLKAVVITSPTYEGVVSHIEQIAIIAHRYGIPLIVDEAHGSHFGTHSQLPPNSCTQGADLVIHSLHKTMPAMTQCAILHRNGELVLRERLTRYLSMYQTSSPSYVLMASIDEAIHQMSSNGAHSFEIFLNRRKEFINQLSQLRNIHIYDSPQGDPCKLIISTKGTDFTGSTISKALREHYQLQMEMAAGNYVIAIMTPSDTEEGIQRLARALIELDAVANSCPIEPKEATREMVIPKTCMTMVIPKTCMTMDTAIDKPFIWELLSKAQGRISAQFVNAYPPGVPILVPGERIEQVQINAVQFLMNKGLELQGMKEDKIRVLELTNG